MTAPDPLDNNRNWVRAAMGLKYLKEGLESFVENEIINLQTTFLQDIRTAHGLPQTATCNQCTFKHNLSAKCPNNLCDKIVVKIVDQHRFTQRNPNGLAKNYNAPCWKNTDATKWGSSPWEISKCFMASGYSGKMSAKETDCTGILSVLINCLSLQNTLTTRINPPNDIISKMRETRNKIMHSSNLEVTNAELQQYIDDMIDILNDIKTIQTQPDVVTAWNKLNQLKTTFVISSGDELKLRKEAVEAIDQKQKEFLEQFQQQQDDLQSKLDRALVSFTQAESASKQQQINLQAKVDQATNSLSKNQVILLQNQKDIQSNQDQVNSLQSQMTELLKKYQLVIDQIVTDKHQEHVKILENKLRDRQLLQTKLRDKYIHLSTISLSPIMKNMKVDINTVYQNLVIRPDLIHDPNINTQTKFYFNRIATKKSVNGYREIFLSKGELCKNIFVVGNGGVGKTTWCLKLLSSWLNCETSDEDKDVLHRFKYIFYVQLRHTKQASQINDMIKSFLFSDEPDLMNTVNDVLLNEPEHCLVLLDGLDEWKLPSEQRINDIGLPHDPLHSKYTTLITSRPWKLEILRLEPSAIDKAVEIKGLDEYGIRQLAGHIIDQLNCARNSHKDLNVFTDCIRKREMPMIEVPLMLSIFVYLWYDNDFIGETFAELYGKLTINLFKNAEGDKRRIKQNREVSKLADIKDIETRKTKWSNTSISLPDCLSKGWCKSYSPLLYSLGKLAFYGLLSINIESFLVFTEESIEEYMSEEELEVALYIGILSQSLSIGDSTGDRFSISFMHKTIQEFLAAVYMVSVTEHDETVNIKSKFTNYCKQIQNVFEIENILKFVCGMDPKLAGELTREISIMHKISDDKRLHQTLMRCVKEEHLYLKESNHVYIVNHFIEAGTNKQNAETLGYINLNHNRVPMCLYIKQNHKVRYPRNPEEGKKAKSEYEDAICRGLSGVHTLEKLVIHGRMLALFNDNICLRISECINHLECQTLELDEITGNLGYIDLSNNTKLKYLLMTSLQIEELSLPQDGRLQSAKLKSIKHLQGDQGRLTLNMNNQQHLDTLTLEGITGNVGHINLSNNSQLTDLYMISLQIEELSLPQDGCLNTLKLKSIKHPDGDQGRLTPNMDNQQQLYLLTLEDITGNVGHIDLSNNSKLSYLSMTSLQIEELSLPQGGCLDTLELKSLKHPQEDQGSLTLNMNNQPYLKQLTLGEITGNAQIINLSNNSKLTDLTMTSLQIEELSLPQDGCLETIKLKSIKHAQGDQGSLTFNFKNQPCLTNILLEDITRNVGHINLSYNSKLKTLILTSIQIEELSLPQNGCLETIKLKSIKHPQGDQGRLTLNMNNQPCLTYLTLEDITENVGHIILSKNSKLKDLTMTSLQIEELSLPHDGCLTSVGLNSIKHPNGYQGRLTLNMNNQLYLKYLILEDITGNVGHINLSYNSKLKTLILTSIQIEELSLPQNGCIETIKLKSIKHPQGDQGRLTLNMNNQHNLEHLTLKYITGNIGHMNLSNNSKLTNLVVISIQIEEISLPQDGCLQRVELISIRNPQVNQGRLTNNMNNQPYLKELTLEDIPENCGHINLSNNKELWYLSLTSLQIEELSLPQNGCLEKVMIVSIKHSQGVQGGLTLNMKNHLCLKSFTLKDISCNIGQIDLSKSTKLACISVISVPLVSITVPPGVDIKR